MKRERNTRLFFKIICPVLVAIFCLSSCQKVVDLDLERASTQIVIEGNLPGGGLGSCVVRVSRSVNFDQKNDFPPVPGAFVTVEDNFGFLDTLPEIAAGIYVKDVIGRVGRTYTLSVVVDGNTYTASSKMQRPVFIEYLSIISNPFNNSKAIGVNFRDPKGVANYYRFVEYRNDVMQKAIFLDDDRLREGMEVVSPLIEPDSTLNSGDRIIVELHSIDKNVYNYFRSLNQLSGNFGMQTATPANPVSNFGNGALGYFSAYYPTDGSITVP
jgi:hypothetical protein